MTSHKKFIMIKAMLNIISGISLATIICLGIAYMSFDNAFVFTDTQIGVTNNPIEEDQDIEFYMIGSKKYQCNKIGRAHV